MWGLLPVSSNSAILRPNDLGAPLHMGSWPTSIWKLHLSTSSILHLIKKYDKTACSVQLEWKKRLQWGYGKVAPIYPILGPNEGRKTSPE